MTDRTAHDIASLHRRLGFTGEALGVWTHRPETGGDRFLTFRVEDVHRVIDEWAAAHPPATQDHTITKGGLDVERLRPFLRHRDGCASGLYGDVDAPYRPLCDCGLVAALEPTHD